LREGIRTPLAQDSKVPAGVLCSSICGTVLLGLY
jgi:hypothetical protein